MRKAKRRTITTIITMTIAAILILMLYFYWSYRNPSKEASVKELTEVEKLLEKDLELYYPETPREVVKLYSNMMKTLYTGITDKEVEGIALKLRELYDTEFFDNNPETEYLKNLYSDIAEWKDNDRTITYFILKDEAMDQEGVIDGKEYAVVNASYTIQEKGKYSEVWRFLLRKNDDKKWKILGWQLMPEEIK